jgi:outer membrane protein assembly factor BamB
MKRSLSNVIIVVDVLILGLLGFWYLGTHPGDKAEKTVETPPAAVHFGTDAWPIFRGDPALTGHAAGQLPDRLALAWTFKTQNPIKSSPVAADGKVFIGSADEHLYALNLSDGTELWRYETGGQIEAAPLVFRDNVYVGADDSFIYALRAATGEEIWTKETGNKIIGSANVVTLNNAASGILVGSYDNVLYCLNPDTGDVIWQYETESYINGTPAVGENMTVIGGCDAKVHIVDTIKGTLLGSVDAEAYIASSAALESGRAYVGNYEGLLLCVDLHNAEILWKHEDIRAPFLSSPAISSDYLLIGAQDKKLHALNKTDGSPVWTFTAQGDVDSSPVIVGDRVVFGSADGRVYVVSLKDGKEIWSYEIGAAVSSSPAVSADTLIVAAEDGVVYAFRQ